MAGITPIGEVISRKYPRCKEPGCPNVPGANGYCVKHPSKPAKEKKHIKKVSDKRTVLNRELAKIVAKIKKQRPTCEMRVPGICTGKTQTAHHSQGKIADLLLDETKMIASCFACNLWEVAHPAEAKAMGISKSRLNKT